MRDSQAAPSGQALCHCTRLCSRPVRKPAHIVQGAGIDQKSRLSRHCSALPCRRMRSYHRQPVFLSLQGLTPCKL